MKNIITTSIIALVLVAFFLGSCGVIAPNTAKVTIVIDGEDTENRFTKNPVNSGYAQNIDSSGTDTYSTYDIFDAYFEYQEDKKADIKMGEEHTYDITWWGENQQFMTFLYSVKNKEYGKDVTRQGYNASIIVRNFDNIKYHLVRNNAKNPIVEYIK